MSLPLLGLAAALVYSAGCVAYVYRWRGQARYDSFTQYLRKSWPVFAPLNCLMYLSTKAWARRPVIAADYLDQVGLLREHWRVLRDEALALEASGAFEAAKAPGSAGFYDVGFRTFYKRGWSKFYLNWYGTTHASARRLCPRSVELLARLPQVRGAMFSILPPGAELSLHADPMACSLRYHLGLDTPGGDACRLQVDDQTMVWRDGQDFVFDETYPHRALNDSDRPRLILMCDVDRPMHLPGRLVHALYLRIARGTVVPNTDEDRRGVFSALFVRLAPWRERSLKLRAERRRTYRALKFLLNSSLLSGLAAAFYGMLLALEAVAA
ncbi:aspartyl/asparaginyl beta-hydroxylase domain-containing protein [Mitsuaria sp. GD03876]|uniref:aspartyl/asparaginyl beta-hydroxylase domain-containing protein n=1 Tax=Mitsuaria sp. GD03876 TaxID=2975399 RepID=UPI002448389B|nr:aspartyl/asparaginyl beta-hydroxylase domain-containing protein [Mitsuaria sp. GD03876]MDH0864696.1 aspartyl/asparaginyl beta-hydroxylase domain-containing protein [Mitsuaria sp. GD03876]